MEGVFGTCLVTEEQTVNVRTAIPQASDWSDQQFIDDEIFFSGNITYFQVTSPQYPKTEPNEVNEIQRSPSTRATRILATISLFEYCKKPPKSFLPPTFSTRTFPSSKHFSTKKNPRKYQKFDWAKEREKRNVAARMHVEF